MLGALIFGGLLAAGASMMAAGSASVRNRQQADLQEESLQLQKEQFEYQKNYDKWQKDFNERNLQLQQSPISTLVKDGSSVGVNPMAALGQNVGSASASSSNANTGFGVSPVSDQITPSLMNMLSSLATTKMFTESQKEIADKNNAMRQQELDLLREKAGNEFELGKESNEIQSRFASVSEQDLARMKAKDAHDNLVADRHLLLQKIDQAYYRKLASLKFANDKAEFAKKFAEDKRQFNASLEQKENEIRTKWDNLSKFERNRLIYRYIKAANDDVMHFFGKGLFSSGDEPYMDTHIGFGAYID